MASVVVDTNVVIGFLEPTDALHERAVEALRPWLEPEHRRLMVTSAYAESLVHPIAAGTDQLVDDFLERSLIELVVIDRGLARAAAGLQARWRGLQLGDALVLATAVEHAAELLTFDDGLWHRWDRGR